MRRSGYSGAVTISTLLSRPRRLFLLVSSVLLLSLNGCKVLEDTQLARVQLTDNSPARHQQALRALQVLADKGYLDATILLAEYHARLGQFPNIDAAHTAFIQMSPSAESYGKRYANWLARLASARPNYRQQAIEVLWQRMRSHGDVGYQLVRLATDSDNAVDSTVQEVFALLDQRGESNSVEKIRILAELEDVAPWFETLTTLCSNTLDARYYCLRSELRYAKKHRTEQLTDLAEQSNTAFQAGELNVEENINLMRLFAAQNADVGTGSQRLAYASAAAAIDTHDTAFLAYANYAITNEVHFKLPELTQRLERISIEHPQAYTLLGRLYMEGRRSVEYPSRALGYLEQALPDPQASYYLGKLLLSGKLGYAVLQEGVDRLLFAARRGEHRAYRELFQLFTNGPGIQPNQVYAHTFAAVYQALGFELSEFDSQLLASLPIQNSEQSTVTELVAAEMLILTELTDE
ncbi:hypothetical protein [Alteromonas flava]|uniref:hypothetical protein n=1 Tax=Alteromonas flava TaxID=2048003 RepID=UPI000F5F05EE|nr:hypothetical protein [Alteromonas flava]